MEIPTTLNIEIVWIEKIFPCPCIHPRNDTFLGAIGSLDYSESSPAFLVYISGNWLY